MVIGSHNAVSETGFAYVYPVGTDTATVTVTVTMPNNGVPVTADGHRAIGGRIATLAWFLGGLIVFVVVVAGLVAVRR